MSGGSGEQALLTAGCAQMHQFYGLPGGAAAWHRDAKLPDMQAGWEQMASNVMAGLSGLNRSTRPQACTPLSLGSAWNHWCLVMILSAKHSRCVRGIEVNDETLGFQTMHDVCLKGPGHYLGSDQTLG